MFLLRFLGLHEVPCIYLANIIIKDILLCIKDTNTPHIFNCHLFKKDKAICSFFFSPTRGILTTSMLMFCVMVGRQSNPQMQAFPPFLVAKGVSKLDTSTECGEEQCQVWGLSISSAIDDKFPAQSMEMSRLQTDTNTLMAAD